MANRITALQIDEVSTVKRGANGHSRVVISKAHRPDADPNVLARFTITKRDDDLLARCTAAVRKAFKLVYVAEPESAQLTGPERASNSSVTRDHRDRRRAQEQAMVAAADQAWRDDDECEDDEGLNGPPTGRGDHETERVSDMTKSEMLRKAHTDFDREVAKLMREEKITKSVAIDRTIAARPDLWQVAKRASVAQAIG